MKNLAQDGETMWRLMGVYGYLDNEDKHNTWVLLKSLNNSSLPWLCFSDYNEVLGEHEKNGGMAKN